MRIQYLTTQVMAGPLLTLLCSSTLSSHELIYPYSNYYLMFCNSHWLVRPTPKSHTWSPPLVGCLTVYSLLPSISRGHRLHQLAKDAPRRGDIKPRRTLSIVSCVCAAYPDVCPCWLLLFASPINYSHSSFKAIQQKYDIVNVSDSFVTCHFLLIIYFEG